MMKIGITCYPTYGGSGVVATELGLELADRGHEVHFISYSQPIRLPKTYPNIHYHEVEVSRYPLFEYPPYDLALATRMAEVAEIYGLDLLHVHYAIPHSVSAMLARQMLSCDHARPRRKLPYVTTLHGTDITLVGSDPSYLPITRFSIDQSDGVTSISDYLKRRTLEVFAVQTPIQVIPNFVNCDLYHRTPELLEHRSEYAGADEKILVHLSNFRPVKRLGDVIEIFDRVQQQIPARLLLIGDGPERSSAEWLAVKKGIHKRWTSSVNRTALTRSWRWLTCCCCRVNWSPSDLRRWRGWRVKLCRSPPTKVDFQKSLNTVKLDFWRRSALWKRWRITRSIFCQTKTS